MPHVELREGDRVDWALKVFRRQVQRAGILKEVRQRRHYTKPSTERRLRAQAARRRMRKGENKRRG
ncbi:MAG: 30S ribosomal protein S21 [Gemmatimonadota bacterium]|nr:30S ribosomal protein S21 [Gemmatimonadota bacterium]